MELIDRYYLLVFHENSCVKQEFSHFSFLL